MSDTEAASTHAPRSSAEEATPAQELALQDGHLGGDASGIAGGVEAVDAAQAYQQPELALGHVGSLDEEREEGMQLGLDEEGEDGREEEELRLGVGHERQATDPDEGDISGE